MVLSNKIKMKKDIYLGKDSDWCKHTRNAVEGRKGVNKKIRRNVKKELKEKSDA